MRMHQKLITFEEETFEAYVKSRSEMKKKISENKDNKVFFNLAGQKLTFNSFLIYGDTKFFTCLEKPDLAIPEYLIANDISTERIRQILKKALEKVDIAKAEKLIDEVDDNYATHYIVAC